MLYVGIDYHKRYAQLNAIDGKGRARVDSARPRFKNYLWQRAIPPRDNGLYP